MTFHNKYNKRQFAIKLYDKYFEVPSKMCIYLVDSFIKEYNLNKPLTFSAITQYLKTKCLNTLICLTAEGENNLKRTLTVTLGKHTPDVKAFL